MMIWPKRSAAVLALGGIAVIVLAGACNDLVAPRHKAAPKSDEPPAYAWDQPDAPTVELTPDATNGSGLVLVGAQFPEQTNVYVIASGYVVQHDNYGIETDHNLGAGGAVAVIEAFPNGSTASFAFPDNHGQSADTLVMSMVPGSTITKVT